MFESNADIDDRLQKLRTAFVLSLPDRFITIDTLWKTVQQQGMTQTQEADELCRVVHTLAGSAGTFGQQRLGEIARNLELMLHHLIANNELATPAIVYEIERERLNLKNSVLGSPMSID